MPLPEASEIISRPAAISGSPGLKKKLLSGLTSSCTNARFPYVVNFLAVVFILFFNKVVEESKSVFLILNHS